MDDISCGANRHVASIQWRVGNHIAAAVVPRLARAIRCTTSTRTRSEAAKGGGDTRAKVQGGYVDLGAGIVEHVQSDVVGTLSCQRDEG